MIGVNASYDPLVDHPPSSILCCCNLTWKTGLIGVIWLILYCLLALGAASYDSSHIKYTVTVDYSHNIVFLFLYRMEQEAIWTAGTMMCSIHEITSICRTAGITHSTRTTIRITTIARTMISTWISAAISDSEETATYEWKAVGNRLMCRSSSRNLTLARLRLFIWILIMALCSPADDRGLYLCFSSLPLVQLLTSIVRRWTADLVCKCFQLLFRSFSFLCEEMNHDDGIYSTF